MGWLKTQKLEYLKNRTKFLICASDDILRSYRFVVEVTFKQFHSFFTKVFVYKRKTSYSKKFTKGSRIKYQFGNGTNNVRYVNNKEGKSITLIKKFINEHSIFYRDIQI